MLPCRTSVGGIFWGKFSHSFLSNRPKFSIFCAKSGSVLIQRRHEYFSVMLKKGQGDLRIRKYYPINSFPFAFS